MGAGHITVFKLGQAGIGLEVDPIDPVIDVLAVELGGAVDRRLERLETRFRRLVRERPLLFAILLARRIVTELGDLAVANG